MFAIYHIICYKRYVILCGIDMLQVLYSLRCEMVDEWNHRKTVRGEVAGKKERAKHKKLFMFRYYVQKHRWIIRPNNLRDTSGTHKFALLGEMPVEGRIMSVLIVKSSLYVLTDRFLYKNRRKIFVFDECITTGTLVRRAFIAQEMPSSGRYHENRTKQRTVPVTSIIGTTDGRVITNGFGKKLFDGTVTHISCVNNSILACSEDRSVILIKDLTDTRILHVELRGGVYWCGLQDADNYFALTECGNVIVNGKKFSFPYKSLCSAAFYRGRLLVGLKNGGLVVCKEKKFGCLSTDRTFVSGQDVFLLNEKCQIVCNGTELYDLSGVEEDIVEFYLKPGVMVLRFKDKIWLLWNAEKHVYEKGMGASERINATGQGDGTEVHATTSNIDKLEHNEMKIREMFVGKGKYGEHRCKSSVDGHIYTSGGRNTSTGLYCGIERGINTEIDRNSKMETANIRRIKREELNVAGISEYYTSAIEINVKSGYFSVYSDELHVKFAFYDRIVQFDMRNELTIFHYRKIVSLGRDVYGCRTGILFYRNELLKISDDAITGIVESNGWMVMCSRDGYIYFLDETTRMVYRKFIDSVFLEGIYIHDGQIVTCGFRSSEFVVYSFIGEISVRTGARPKKWSFNGHIFSFVRQNMTFFKTIKYEKDYLNDADLILTNSLINCSCVSDCVQFVGDFEGNVFALKNYTLVDRIRLKGEVNDIKVQKHKRSTYLYCCTNDSYVYKIFFKNGLLLEERSLKLKNRILSIAMNDHVYVSSSSGMVYKLTMSLAVLQSVDTQVLNFSMVCVGADLLLAGTDGCIRAIGQNMEVIRKLKVHNNAILKIACNEQKLYSVGDDHTLRIADIGCNRVMNKKVIANSPVIDVKIDIDRIYILCKNKQMFVLDLNLEIVSLHRLYLRVVNSFEILGSRLLVLGEGIETVFIRDQK